MKPRRDEQGPRQEAPASRLRSESMTKAPSSKLRSDASGKAPLPDKAKAGPSWKKAAAKAGEREPTFRTGDPERITQAEDREPTTKGKAPERPTKAGDRERSIRARDPEQTTQAVDPERTAPAVDTAEEQAPARPQGAVPVVEAPAGAPKWKAKAVFAAGVTSGQVVPKSTQAEGSTPAPVPVQPSEKLHEREPVLRHDPEAKLHQDGDKAPGPGPEAASAPKEGKRNAGDTIRRWQKDHAPTEVPKPPEDGHGPTTEAPSPTEDHQGPVEDHHGHTEGRRPAEGHRPKGPAPKPTGDGPGHAGTAPVSGEVTSPELTKATERVEKRSGKLDKAQGKLARQKPPKRPGPVKRATGYAGRTLHGYVHGKVYESEHENVGLEGAHRVELAGETLGRSGVRSVKRKVRQHPAKVAQRAERRYAKAKAEQVFQQARLEHPELTRDKGPLARMWRKRRLKKQYQKQAQKAAKKTAQETATVTERLGRAIVGFIRRHPGGCALAVLVVLLLLVMQSCMSSVTVVGNGILGGTGGSTHPAEEADLTGAEAAYVAMETQLQDYLDNYTANHSYNEYHFDLDEIEHDPYVLLVILSALHDGEWTLADVQGDLQTVFDRQYILTETVVRETRYRRQSYTGADGSPQVRLVPYSYYICTVTLENANLSHLPVYMMSTDQLSRYALYMASLGNRPDLFPTSEYVDKYITNPPAPHEVPEAYLADPAFAAMLAEAEKYLGYPYVWGGSSPATSFDCSGFVSWVANQCGWNIGRLGATGLYNICTRVTTPKPGDIVFFAGTFDAEGVTHCGIYVGDGWMLHCGDPIQYANLNTSYWQSHFYAYGRLP